MYRSILFTMALLIGSTQATALSRPEVQDRVDVIQKLAFNYMKFQKQGLAMLSQPEVDGAVQTLLNETQQGPQCLGTLQQISRLAYQIPTSELMNTKDIKKLLSVPAALLGIELSGAKLEAAKVLQAVASAYQKGQPVKAQVLNAAQQGNQLIAQVRYFPDVIAQVEIIDQTKVSDLIKRTDVTYVFDTKTGKLVHMSSEAYNQALDLRIGQTMARN